MTARMARLQKEIPRGVTLVSFTVDPAYDTREILTEYAKRVSKGDGWLFVTGAQSALYTLSTQGFKLAAMEVPPDQQRAQDGPFLHSSRFVLVDRSGRVRGYYDSTDEDAVARLKGDLSRLLRREAP